MRRTLRLLFKSLPRRAWLTLQHLGLRAFLFRIVTFPLRLTPLGRRLGLGPIASDEHAVARRWYRAKWRPVAVVIPTYGDPEIVFEAVRAIRRTTQRSRVHVIVADDGSAPEHQARLRELKGVELILGEQNVGFAANSNRGLRAAPPGHDVVLMNSDVIAQDGWLEILQHGVYASPDIGMAGPMLLYPDGTIQSAGSHRNVGAPEWFDHRYRFAPPSHGPANVNVPVIGATGACLYVTRETLDDIGLLDEAYPMAFEDADWCLRCWQSGRRVMYIAASRLVHHESKTRGTEQGEREVESKRVFWERWGPFFDERPVRTPEGKLRVIYVTEDTGVGGGHRVVFQHLEALAERGHDVELWSLEGAPSWYPLEVPVRAFDDYVELVEALEPEKAVKVATWWNTAAPVWRASVEHGIPVYFVQDIETSYYPGNTWMQHVVTSSYRQEFRYLTTSGWNRERLREMGVDPVVVSPGIDLGTFHPLEGVEREDSAMLALGRSQPLKNFPLTLAGWHALGERRPELWLFGIEPQLAENGARYFTRPSDAEVNELMNRTTVFVQTSRHEGFCLPLLEAMATGAPVVCTDADGNRDFIRDGENALMVEPEPEAVAAALRRLLDDAELRARLGEQGRRTAESYSWARKAGELAAFYESIAP